jgi:CTP:molybdopterin cytidylyltransferase MocA
MSSGLPPTRERREVGLKEFAGLILAGGEGKRWGGPKAWAELPDGRSFLECCLDTLAKAGAFPIVATLPPRAENPNLPGLLATPLTEPGLDMFASLKAGLGLLIEHPGWQAVAVLPVDHPLVNPKTVTALLYSEAKAAIPSFNGKHGHPIRIDRRVVEDIALGSLTGPTLREVLRAAEAVDVPVDDPGVTTNCNTPEALAKALESSHQRTTTQNS